MNYSNKDRYRGQWKEDMKHGRGKVRININRKL